MAASVALEVAVMEKVAGGWEEVAAWATAAAADAAVGAAVADAALVSLASAG